MTELIGILCFINGAVCAVCALLVRELRHERTSGAKPAETPDERTAKQLLNMYAYDGTTRGQIELDD